MGSIKGQKHNPYLEGRYAHINPNDVESITVFDFPMRLMSSRISTNWFGSNPVVGSSKINTSGS